MLEGIYISIGLLRRPIVESIINNLKMFLVFKGRPFFRGGGVFKD